jgi:hypothetical protein
MDATNFGLLKTLGLVLMAAASSFAISYFEGPSDHVTPLYGQIITVLVAALLGMIGLTYRGIVSKIDDLKSFMETERDRMDRFIDTVFELELSHHNDRSREIMEKFRNLVREERKIERSSRQRAGR